MLETKKKKKRKRPPTTRAGRRAKHPDCLPARFEPKCFEKADNRLAIIKEVRRRLERLKNETGADSYQKEMICEEAVFLALQLETMRTTALEGGEIDFGSYVQTTNCLQGLLSKLGLEKQARKVESLSSYVNNGKSLKR